MPLGTTFAVSPSMTRLLTRPSRQNLASLFLLGIASPACVATEPDDEPSDGSAFRDNQPLAITSNEVAVPCNADLRAIIEAAPNDTTLRLGACTYAVSSIMRDGIRSGIQIKDKKRLAIMGAGQGRSVVQFARDTYIGFEIGSGTQDLTISSLTVRGSITKALCDETPASPTFVNSDGDKTCYTTGDLALPNTHLIGSRGGARGVARVTVRDVELADASVGLSVGSACESGAYDGAIVENNYVHDMHGKYTGSGYGLHVACATDVVFRNNLIERPHRHGIYVAMTSPTNEQTLRVIGNTIVDHGGQGEGPTVQEAALVLARADNVLALNNTIVGGTSSYALSAEYDAQTKRDCTRCAVVGNRFLRTSDSKADIWVNAHSQVELWNNQRGQAAAPIANESGNAVHIAGPGGFWAGTQALTAYRDQGEDYVAVMQGNVLHRLRVPTNVLPSQWRDYSYSTTNWFNFSFMTASASGLFVLQNNVLHGVNAQSTNGQWPYQASPTQWFRTAAITANAEGAVFVVQNGTLHRLNPTDWTYIYDTSDWGGTEAISVVGDRVYALQRNVVYAGRVGENRTAWTRAAL